MSKNLTRKGLAIGTALSFALTGLSALPASADDAGLVTLMPSAGKTFNALSGDSSNIAQGITLKATVDSDLSNGYARLSYLISNPNRATLTFDADGTEDVLPVVNGVVATTGADSDKSNAAVIAVFTNNSDGTETLNIKSTKEAAFTVQSYLDKDADGIVDAGETASKAEAVNLYDPKNVTVSASIDSALTKGETSADLKFTFSKSVNADQVNEAVFGYAIYENGVNRALGSADINKLSFGSNTNGDDYALSADIVRLGFGTPATDSVGRGLQTSASIAATAAGKNYSVRVAYLADADGAIDLSKVVWAGSRSSAIYLPVHADSTVTDLAASVNDSKNIIDEDIADLQVRSGVKTVKFTAQAKKSGPADYATSNVNVKAVLTPTNVTTGAKFSFEGSSEVLSKTTESSIVYGRTDADGKFTVSVTSTTAAATDAYDVDFYFLGQDDTWGVSAADTASVTYEDAVIDAFTAVSSIIAGANVTASFKVVDQFGQAISKTADGAALSVYLADGDTTKLKKTAAVVDGKASITFANYLTKGDSSSLTAKLFYGSDSDDVVSAVGSPEVTLYNPEATGAVIVDAKAADEITYSAFVTGDPSKDNDADTIPPLVGDKIPYTGRIEDAAGAGLPGAVVTVAGAGLQFEDATTAATNEFYKDTITVVADASGKFTVNVWTHKVGATTITVTSGGKSGKTVLTGYFNTGTTTADVSLNATNSGTELIKVTWNLQKHPAVNGTYIVQAVVSDKWGNVLKGAKVNFVADGALLVNGKDEVERTTSSAGKATVYLGTVKDAKGFGSLSATVTSVSVDRDADGTVDVAIVKINAEENLTVSSDLVVGTDASAAASKTKGLVKASVWNAKGKTVQVYVSGKLVATKKATSASYSFNVKSAKGDKKVTVKVSGSTYFSEVITVK